MDIRKRAETFSRYVSLELKGTITTQGYTAKAVAEGIGRQPAAFNRWLNGKIELPLTVFGEACEYIDVEPNKLIDDAYSRMVVELGERDGNVYLPGDDVRLEKQNDSIIGVPDSPKHESSNVIVGGFGQSELIDAERRVAMEDPEETGEDLE